MTLAVTGKPYYKNNPQTGNHGNLIIGTAQDQKTVTGTILRVEAMGIMLLKQLSDWKPWHLIYRNISQPGNYGNHDFAATIRLETMATVL